MYDTINFIYRLKLLFCEKIKYVETKDKGDRIPPLFCENVQGYWLNTGLQAAEEDHPHYQPGTRYEAVWRLERRVGWHFSLFQGYRPFASTRSPEQPRRLKVRREKKQATSMQRFEECL